MKRSKIPEVSVDEIMKEIAEEVAKKSNIPHASIFGSGAQPMQEGGIQSTNSIVQEASEQSPVRGILWTYGTRYAKLIKRIPGLNRIAEYYYWRLADVRRPPAGIAASPSAGCGILPTNLNYAGFIEGLKHEGLKGRIKRRIFMAIGFFAWWQGQVNSALYEKLAEQEAQLAEQEAQLAEQETQRAEQEAQLAEMEGRLTELGARLADRDGVIKELSRKLAVLSRLEDAVYEELTAQRAEIARRRGLLAHSVDSRANQD